MRIRTGEDIPLSIIIEVEFEIFFTNILIKIGRTFMGQKSNHEDQSLEMLCQDVEQSKADYYCSYGLGITNYSYIVDSCESYAKDQVHKIDNLRLYWFFYHIHFYRRIIKESPAPFIKRMKMILNQDASFY